MEGEGQQTALRVDPGALRTFADGLRARSTEVTALDAGNGFQAASNALPGTDFGTVAQQATDAVNRSLRRIGERLTGIADSTVNAAAAYEVTEADFTSRLETIGMQLP